MVQNTHDIEAVFARPVNNEVRSDRVDPMRRRQVVSTMTDLRVEPECHERVVDFIAVDDELIAAPGFAGKA